MYIVIVGATLGLMAIAGAANVGLVNKNKVKRLGQCG